MDATVPRPAPAANRHQRHVRNYLINPRFQLKYTGFLVGLTLTFSLALGGALWRTGNEALSLSRTAVDKASETVQRGQDLVRENQKVSTMARMTIDRAYADQPELGRVFAEEDLQRTEALRGEQARLEHDATRLRSEAEGLEQKQRSLMAMLVAGLAALVLFSGAVGVIITHKVAGPIFKMKRQLREVGDGRLRRPGKLRRGDELVDFFEAFEDMVDRLRSRQKAEIGRVDAILGALDRNDAPSAVVTLRALRDEMQAHLD